MKLIPWLGRSAKPAFVALAVLFMSTSMVHPGHAAPPAPMVQDVTPAPMLTVTDIEGHELSIADNVAAGRPTVIYFMASWCPICATNWEALSAVVPRYEGVVDFIAISIDITDTVEVLTELAAEKNFAFRTAAGNIDAMFQFGVTAQTAKFAIDKNGNIVYRHDGALTEAEWEAIFATLADG